MKRPRPTGWERRRRRIASPYHVALAVVSILAADKSAAPLAEARALRGIVPPSSVLTTLRFGSHHHHSNFLRGAVSSSAPKRIENIAASAVQRLRGVVRPSAPLPDADAGIHIHRMDDLNKEETWLQWLSPRSDKVDNDNQMKQHEHTALGRINTTDKLHVTVPEVVEKTPVQTVLTEEGIDMMKIDLE